MQQCLQAQGVQAILAAFLLQAQLVRIGLRLIQNDERIPLGDQLTILNQYVCHHSPVVGFG